MSVLLRSLPAIAYRCKPFSVKLLPLLYLNFHTPFKPQQLPKRSVSSISASAAATPSSTETIVPTALKQPISIPYLEWVNRTAFCGELSETDLAKRVRLCGWVALHRVHGGLTFVNLRDHTGIVQITTLPDEFPDAHSTVNDLRLEYVAAVEGVVRPRPSESVNKKMKTGAVEVAAEHVHVLNTVRFKLPFLVTTVDDAKDSVKEEIRLRCRCPDLRRLQMNSNIMLRYQVVKLIRRSTPEGARDYRVPSRIQVFNEIIGVQLPDPFPRLTYAEAMGRYGSDRPDTRFDLELKDVSDVFSDSSFKVFADTLESGGVIKALCVPSGAKTYSNTTLRKGDIYSEAIKSGAKGLPFLKVLEDGSGDLILFAVGHPASVNKTLDRLRVYVAQDSGLIDPALNPVGY